MPLVKWACPEGSPTYGQSFEPTYCITKCPHRCASPFLLAAMTFANQSNHHKGKYMSATSLSGCTRKLQLERLVDYADFVKNAFYAYRGTVMHAVVENAADVALITPEGADLISLLELGYITEWHMKIGFCLEHGGFAVPDDADPDNDDTWGPCPTCVAKRTPKKRRKAFLLGGTMDGLEPLWHQFDPETGVLPCIIWDLKTMADYAMTKFITGDSQNEHHPNVKDEHFLQLHVYKYLGERSLPPETLRARGVKKLVMVAGNIQGFGMSDMPRTGGSYRYRKSYRSEWVDYHIPSVEFKEDEWVEEYIRDNSKPRIRALIDVSERGEITEPAKNSKGAHSWMCTLCAFHGSAHCPDPEKEWKWTIELSRDGMSREDARAQAFRIASGEPEPAPEGEAFPAEISLKAAYADVSDGL